MAGIVRGTRCETEALTGVVSLSPPIINFTIGCGSEIHFDMLS